jgi:hypothetical protein
VEVARVNVRIPPSPALLLRLIREFSLLRDDAAQHGDDWPEDLEAWSETIERHANGGAPR